MTSSGFMQSALVQWVQTFSAEPLTYQDLSDGIFLNEVLQQIDPKARLDGLINHVEEANDRLNNWDVLLKNTMSFFQDVLQQLVIMKPPDLHCIASQPNSEEGQSEMSRMLLLLLGAAVHCEHKIEFVETIKERLDIEVQHCIVTAIKQITQSLFVLDGPADDLDDVAAILYSHVSTLLAQRDTYTQELRLLHDTIDQYQYSEAENNFQTCNDAAESFIRYPSPSRARSHSPGIATGSTLPDRRRVAVELAENRAKIRKLRQEVEDRSDQVAELQEDLASVKQSVQKLRNENMDLIQEARSAKFYRDELDILRDKVVHVNRLESEAQRYKERLAELDFYKARVDEMRADSDVLMDSRRVLEEELVGCHQRIEAVVQLEIQLQQYSKQISELSVEREKNQTRITELLSENATLMFNKQRRYEENCIEDDSAQLYANHKEVSLSEQLFESTNAQILRLELENRRLKEEMDALRENELLGNVAHRIEVDKENVRLGQKVEECLQNSTRETLRCIELERVRDEIMREKRALEETMETVQENTSRQIRELEQEREQMAQTIEVLRSRNEKTADAHHKDLETENIGLHESVRAMTSRVLHLEGENVQAERRSRQVASECKELLEALQASNAECHQSIGNLTSTIEILRFSSERIENEAEDLRSERDKLSGKIEDLRRSVAERSEEVGLKNHEVVQLTSVVEQLKRTVADVEARLSDSGRKLETSLGTSRVDRLRCTQLEHEALNLAAERCRLETDYATAVQRIELLERSSLEAESDSTELRRGLDGLKEQLEREREWARDQEVEGKRLRLDKAAVEKENRKLKQAMDGKEEKMEELCVKIKELEKNSRAVAGLDEHNKEMEERLEELEKECLSLTQQSKINKNTLSALREDLVNEKIRFQKIKDELDGARQQIKSSEQEQRRSAESESASEDSGYRGLENHVVNQNHRAETDEEERICVLENQILELKGRNEKLEHDLIIQSQKSSQSAPSATGIPEKTLYVTQRYSDSLGATQQISQLKNRIVDIEKINEALQAENLNLKEQRLNHQVMPSNRVILKLNNSTNHQQAVPLCFSAESIQRNSSRYEVAQSQLARLQVENTTLTSQNASLVSQYTDLQLRCGQVDAELQRTLQRLQEEVACTEQRDRSHDVLQRLHEQLTREYDSLLLDHGNLKMNHKQLKADLHSLHDQNASLAHEKETMFRLREALEKDQENLRNESIGYGSLKADYYRLREENQNLFVSNDSLKHQLENQEAELRHSRNDANKKREAADELRCKVDEYERKHNAMHIELVKLLNHCEVLAPMNIRLEEENQSLMIQLRGLMSQNQELLTSLLNNKDRGGCVTEDQRIYAEKLSEIKRQKDSLEEMIQVQRKRYDPIKKKSNSFAVNFMKKARQMVTGRWKDKGAGLDSPNNSSSLGSDSVAPISMENLGLIDRLAEPGRPRFVSDRGPSLMSNKDGQRQEGLGKNETRLLLGDLSDSSARRGSRSPVMRTTKSCGQMVQEDDDDAESISLDQFLKECNMSPKSRRRLMVEKRITLDDINESKTSICTNPFSPTLPPRSPTIPVFPFDGGEVTPKRLVAQSDWNVSADAKNSRASNDPLRNYQSLPRSNKHSAFSPDEKNNSVGNRFPPEEKNDVALREPRETTNATRHCVYSSTIGRTNSFVGTPSRTSYQSPAAGYADVGAANIARYSSATSQQISGGFDSHSRPAGHAHNYRERVIQSDATPTGGHLQDRRRSVGYANGNEVKNMQQGQRYSQRKPDPRLIVSESTDQEMSSQYNPGNVRNLVQSYQDTVKPTLQEQQQVRDHQDHVQRQRSHELQRQSSEHGKQEPQWIEQRHHHRAGLMSEKSLQSGQVQLGTGQQNGGHSRGKSRPVSAGPMGTSANNAFFSLPGENNSDNFDADPRTFVRPMPVRVAVGSTSEGKSNVMRPLSARPMATAATVVLSRPEPGTRLEQSGMHRTDGNVCIVRPASGRSLPQPPASSHLIHNNISNSSGSNNHNDYRNSPSLCVADKKSSTTTMNQSSATGTWESNSGSGWLSTPVEVSRGCNSRSMTPNSVPVRNVENSSRTTVSQPPQSRSKTQGPAHTDPSGRPKVYEDYGCL